MYVCMYNGVTSGRGTEGGRCPTRAPQAGVQNILATLFYD